MRRTIGRRDRRGARWRCAAGLLGLLTGLASAADSRDRGADGHFEKRTSSHFVLYQDVDIDETAGLRGSRSFEQHVLQTLETAYDRLDEYLGLRPGRPVTVVVYDPQVFDGRFAGLFRFAAAGFYEGTVHIRGDTIVHDQLVRVLHHELVHAAFDAAAPSLLVPAWLNEGLAEWFEARAVGQRLLSARQHDSLANRARQGSLYTLSELSQSSFGQLGPQSAHLAYTQAHGFIAFLVRHHGQRSLRELCRSYVRTHDLERAFRRTYRVPLASMEKDFASELAGGRG